MYNYNRYFSSFLDSSRRLLYETICLQVLDKRHLFFVFISIFYSVIYFTGKYNQEFTFGKKKATIEFQ